MLIISTINGFVYNMLKNKKKYENIRKPKPKVIQFTIMEKERKKNSFRFLSVD